MSALTKIKALQSSLTSNEAKLAAFTLASPRALRDLSSSQLAKQVGISQSSVVKFAQKLGYKGYPAFKLALLDAINKNHYAAERLHGEITIDDPLPTMADKLLAGKIKVLQETRSLNEHNHVEQAVQALLQAKRILITGVGGSSIVCADFCYKLRKLGLYAQHDSDSHVQLAVAATLSEHDLVFAISESGATKEVLRVVKEARRHGSQVIALTHYGKTPISHYADMVLFSIAEADSMRLASIHARTAQNWVIDLLFIALIQASEHGRSVLALTNKAFVRMRQN
jgi:DNA-binding MurR/RpiR family transcriptional regulator